MKLRHYLRESPEHLLEIRREILATEGVKTICDKWGIKKSAVYILIPGLRFKGKGQVKAEDKTLNCEQRLVMKQKNLTKLQLLKFNEEYTLTEVANGQWIDGEFRPKTLIFAGRY